VLGVVPLLRAEGGEEESQVGLAVPEDIRATEAETMILPRTPEESLIVLPAGNILFSIQKIDE